MNKISHYSNNIFRTIFIISIILLSITGTVRSEEKDKPSDSLEFELLFDSKEEYKQSDSLEFKLFYGDDEDKKPTHWQVGILGLLSTGSDDNKNGYGGALLLAYDKFCPVVLRLTPHLYWSEFERILPGENILSLNADLDMLFISSFGYFKPYAGLGINYYNNYWPTDEPVRKYEIGGYDEFTQTIKYDYGSGWAQHLRAGIQIVTDLNLSFVLDLKFTNIRTEMPVLYHYSNGDERKGYATYKLNPISIYFGITTRIKE